MIAFSVGVNFPKVQKLLMFEKFDVLAHGRDTAEWFCLGRSKGCFCYKMLSVYTTISSAHLKKHICFIRAGRNAVTTSTFCPWKHLGKKKQTQSWSLSPPGGKRLSNITNLSHSMNPTPAHRTGQPMGSGTGQPMGSGKPPEPLC